MNSIEQRICSCIDAHASELTAFAHDIYTPAETGYVEHRTARAMGDLLKNRC